MSDAYPIATAVALFGLTRADFGLAAPPFTIQRMFASHHPRQAPSRAWLAAARHAARVVAVRPARRAVTVPACRPRTALP